MGKKNHDDGRIAPRGNPDSLLFFSNMCAEQYYLKKILYYEILWHHFGVLLIFHNFSVDCFSVFLYSYSHFIAVVFAVSVFRPGYI